jgi:hypothetical protein
MLGEKFESPSGRLVQTGLAQEGLNPCELPLAKRIKWSAGRSHDVVVGMAAIGRIFTVVQARRISSNR